MAVDTSGLRRKLELYGERLAAEGAAELLRTVDREVPVDTGQLKGVGDISRVGRRRWRIWYPAEYASFTDTGTRPHVIRPRNARALRFPTRGGIVFATRVNHPGTRGTRWFSGNVTSAGWKQALRRGQRRVARF